MKRFIVLLFALFCSISFADTINIDWITGNNVYTSTTCNMGDDLILPTAPTKPGYTFRGWKMKGYTPVEYLESTGTQYIDTGFAFNDNLKQYPFTVDFTVAAIKDVAQDTFARFSGGGSAVMSTTQMALSNPNDRITIYITTNNNIAKTFYVNNYFYQPFHLKYEFDQSLGVYTVYYENTSETLNIPGSQILATSNKNIYLFKSNSSDPVVPIRIYNFVYESNGIKIRDFIPVIDENRTPCMFDKVEGKFYYNAGTGQFIAGPIINEQ